MAGPNPGANDTIFYRKFSRTADADVDVAIDDNIAQQLGIRDNRFYNDLISFKPSTLLTFRQVVEKYTANKSLQVQVYCVADGSFMSYADENQAWFNPHVRFLVLICPTSARPLSLHTWTHCIVGSWNTDDKARFVQVATWDSIKFSFFSRENLSTGSTPGPIYWLYQGNSFDAFRDETAYLGPFNGHVNGSLIMKELHSPWLHWYSPDHTNLSQCFDTATINQLVKTPWISKGSSSNPLQMCRTANELETLVEDSVNFWMMNRKSANFKKTSGQSPSNVNIQRWMSHLLLTTTINIQPGEILWVAKGQSIAIPPDFFYNTKAAGCQELFKNLPTTFAALLNDYNEAVKSLNLALLQEIDPTEQRGVYDNLPADQKVLLYAGTLGGGKQTDEHSIVQFAIAQKGEGYGPFTCLITSFEDITGAFKMQSAYPSPALVSTKFLQSIFMVDFANPVYSWRRGVLMQYCPIATNPTSGDDYDLEETFVKNVTASPNGKIAGQPEYVFLTWYNKPDISSMQSQIQRYLHAVVKNLNPTSGSAAIVTDYMKLAESRRRIYRPLPLDEFGFSLPFALEFPGKTDIPLLEMSLDGTVQTMPPAGQQFISNWTGTLWTDNPRLLPTFPSTLGTAATASDSPAPIAPWLLPGRGKSLAVCERSGTLGPSATKPKGCPMKSIRTTSTKVQAQGKALVAVEPKRAEGSRIVAHPVWNDVLALFQTPYWLPVSEQAAKGKDWHHAMVLYGNPTSKGKAFDLWDEGCVKENVITIYQHLASQSMPITGDPTDYWPADALHTLRNWANQGFRTTGSDPILTNVVVIAHQPAAVDPQYRTRKDIRSMTDFEINTFRAKLDDVLGCFVLGSKWQELCRLHGEWCLHYQEAFSLWHRAYLRYVEDLIDFPIPYWNTLDPECSDPNSPASGLPQAFLDQTYHHPVSGETRPNPLLYALALDGKSTAGGPYIARDPTLTKNDRSSPEFAAKVAWLTQYQTEFQNTLAQNSFSYAENVTTGAGDDFGVPWQNLPAFKQNMPDTDYVYSNKVFPYAPNFDGFFEQVHDNGHGWIGGSKGDMSDNAHTAADPIFLVYHANLDRVLDAYLSTHPQAQYTSNFPLRPFTGSSGTSLDYLDPRSYVYTTIGDMAKDTRSLKYIYAPPFANQGKDLLTEYRDANDITGARRQVPPTRGGSTVAPPLPAHIASSNPVLTPVPQITFRNIKCTEGTYVIDIFTKDARSKDPSLTSNPAFLGRITRLGMGAVDKDDTARLGPGDSNCRASTVTRTLLLTGERASGEVLRGLARDGFVQVVRDWRAGGKIVPEKEWSQWDGFRGVFEVGVEPGKGG